MMTLEWHPPKMSLQDILDGRQPKPLTWSGPYVPENKFELDPNNPEQWFNQKVAEARIIVTG